MVAPPRNWPHLLVEDGPAIAGIAPGDAIAIVPGARVFVRAIPWLDDRPGLFVFNSLHEVTTANAWRVDVDGRVQYWDYESDGSNVEWRDVPASVSTSSSTSPAGVAVTVGPWRLRFVSDGPVLASTKRFGSLTAAHCHHVSAQPADVARSEWILPEDGARNVVVVEDGGAPGDLRWFIEPRRAGVELTQLAAAAHESGGIEGIGKELAAGIVAQWVEGETLSIIGFDGRVILQKGARSVVDLPAVEVYGLLTRPAGRRHRQKPPAASKLQAELASVRPAEPDEIAAAVRALCPEAWAREQALVEECGVFAP